MNKKWSLDHALSATKHMIRVIVQRGGLPARLLVHPTDRHNLWKGFETIEGIPLDVDSSVRPGEVIAVDGRFKKQDAI